MKAGNIDFNPILGKMTVENFTKWFNKKGFDKKVSEKPDDIHKKLVAELGKSAK